MSLLRFFERDTLTINRPSPFALYMHGLCGEPRFGPLPIEWGKHKAQAMTIRGWAERVNIAFIDARVWYMIPTRRPYNIP
jgi:hypothetical protein